MKNPRFVILAIYILVSFMTPNIIYSQYHSSNHIGQGWNAVAKETRRDKKDMNSQVKVVKIETIGNINDWTADTKYYRDIQVDSLWYVGVGSPIKEKNALKMDTVYRLSMKMNNGKYIHVESLCYGLPSSSTRFRSRLLPIEKYDYSNDLDSTWVKAQNNITQIYQYPSTGNRKACELDFDINNNLIHAESIDFTTDGKAIIIYSDSSGNIINLTDANRYKNGTIVVVDSLNEITPRYTVSDIGGWPIQIR